MHKRGLCRHAVSVCLSVCLSRSWIISKRINISSKIFHHSHTILVFPYQTGWRYSDGNPLNGGVECRWHRQKRDSGRISGFAAYRSTVLSTVRVANCEKQSRNGAHRRVRRLLFAQDNDEVFVMGSTLYAGEEVKLPPDTTPSVITPVFCCRRTS